MKDTKFFEQALELVAPWKVVEVNMDITAKKVEIKVDCGSAAVKPHFSRRGGSIPPDFRRVHDDPGVGV